tara:strand:+ start:221 stop:634 length:414 start_codon:yes stop_codon:yes gene_type:complete
MKEGVENMYKRDEHYNSVISKADLERELDTHYTGETGLVISLMSRKIQDGTIQTRHELGVANEELWGLNDWPEGEGFGTSDFFHYNNMIDKTIARERKFLQAEAELVAINKLADAPKNDDVHKYMKMNEKVKEGLVA